MHKIIGNYLSRHNELLKFLFSTHKIKEIKNNYMLVVKDQNQLLPYMAQIQTDQGRNGIVLKIDQNGDAYIGMYEPFENSNSLQIKQINKNWKKSFNKITQSIINHQNNSIFDVNSNKIHEAIDKSHKQQKNAQITNNTVYNGGKRRVKTSSPILNICNDIYYGDMISFLGCRGSKKTSNAVKIISDFNNDVSGNSVSIYINPQFRESKQVINKKTSNVYAFSVAEKTNPTDIGVYMLTLKTIGLCNKLKEQGLDVLLVVDNFKQILTRQWNFMQTIKFDSKKSNDFSASFQYNNIKIAPISILNEIFSSCIDQFSSKSIKKTTRKGSLTTLVLSQKQQREQSILVQQTTSYSNNIKHLITLSNTIQFPIDIKTNKNSYIRKGLTNNNKINPNIEQEEEHNSSIVSKPQSPDQIYNYLRRVINDYLVQKKQSQLKRNLYKNDIRDSPWDYYNLLDAQWWIKGLKQIQASNYHECKNVCFWLKFNIQKQIMSQWTISAKHSYTKFIQFLMRIRGDLQKNDSKTIQFTREDMQQFLEQAKIEGLLNPFKKDYLL